MVRRLVSPDLVGRRLELAVVEDLLAELADGGRWTLLVSGEAGIGKSRLLSELCARAFERDLRVLLGHCLNLETVLPFAPLVEALRGLLSDRTAVQLADTAGPSAEQLARLVPELRTVVDPGGSEDRLALFSAISDVLRKVAAERATVLAVEDVQWADASTRDVISFVARTVDAPLAVVLTDRDTDQEPSVTSWLEELTRSARGERLELGPLEGSAISELVEAIADRRPSAAEVARLTERTSGNPFFVEELLSAPGGELRSELAGLLRRRIDRLDPDARRVVDAAAVGGSPTLDGDLLAAVTGIEPETLPQILRAIVDGGVFDVRPGDRGYRFRHGLVAEAAEAALVPDQLVAWHRAWAQVLSVRASTEPDVLGAVALHWEAAGEPGRGLPAALAAADAATTVFAHPEAAAQYERALRLWSETDVAPQLDRGEVLERAATASALAGDPSRAVTLVRGALAETEDPLRSGLLNDRLAEFLITAGDEEAGLAAMQRALELIPAEPPTAEAAFVRARAAYGTLATDRFRKAKGFVDEAVRISRLIDAPAQLAWALSVRTYISSCLGDFERAALDLEAAEHAADVADAADDEAGDGTRGRDERRLMLGWSRLSLLVESGEYDAALDLARQVIPVARAVGRDLREGIATRGYAAWLCFQLGRWQECEGLLEELVDLKRQAHFHGHVTRLRLDLEVATGRFTAAEGRIGDDVVLPSSDAQAQLEFTRARAEMELWRGRPTEALAVCEAGLRRTLHDGAGHLASGLLAAALRAHADLRGRTDAASEEDRRRLLDRLRAATENHRQGEVVAWRATGLAEFARAAGDRNPQVWHDATAAWEDLRVPYRAAYCEFRRAETLLHGSGARSQADGPLRSAHAVAVSLGAAPLLNQVEALGRRARIPLTTDDGRLEHHEVAARTDPLADYGITARERDVLALLAEGRTNADIARTLFVTEKTVEAHVSNLLRKMGAANRVEAAMIFHRSHP